MPSSKGIVKELGNSKLDLRRDRQFGYWYFEYDNEKLGLFKTQVVRVLKLKDMPKDQILEIGRNFLKTMKEHEDWINIGRV